MSKPRKNATRVAKKTLKAKTLAREKQIKRYINFKFDGSEYSARKIREIYNELWPLLHQPHTDYVPRTNNTKKVALASVGLRQRKAFKKVPVPSNGREGNTVKFKNNRLVIVGEFEDQEIILFDKRALASDPVGHTNSLVKKFGRNNLFKVKTGEYETAIPQTRDMIADEVAKLQLKYQVGNTVLKGQRQNKVTINENQAWDRWLNGLVRIDVKRQADIDRVMKREAARKKERDKGYKKNKKHRIK